MASGTLLDLDTPEGSAPREPGHRPLLTRPQMLVVRCLLAVSAPIYVLLLAMNYRPVGDAVFRLSSQHMWVALSFGIMVVIVVSTYLVLLGVGLYHFVRGHPGPRPPAWWPWVMVLLNVPGAAAYYLRVIEPEQRALRDDGPAAVN